MKRELLIGWPFVALSPFIRSQCKVAYTRFVCELSRILQPVIEPPQQDRIGVKIGRRPKSSVANAIAPRNMYPRPDNQVLPVACKIAATMLAQRNIACDRSLEIQIVPASKVQRGNLYSSVAAT